MKREIVSFATSVRSYAIMIIIILLLLLLSMITDLFNSFHLWNIELNHILNPSLQCNCTAGTI